VERVIVTGHSKTKSFPDDNEYPVTDNDVEVLVFSLFENEDNSSISEEEQEDEHSDKTSGPASFHHMRLPHGSLNGLWDTLVYEDPIAELTLRTLTRAILESRDQPSTQSFTNSWQNTLLFHGPPGSGKTSLALALAQRLSIRLSNTLFTTRLLQVSAHDLFSRFFGQTAKQVGQIFKTVLDMATDDSQLLVVLFDEVESVASARQLVSQNEPAESARVSVASVCLVVYTLS
jgi:DNA polymerase III delta prime subunit